MSIVHLHTNLTLASISRPCYIDSMSWVSKEQSTRFDTTPISGVFFLDGDLFAKKLLIDFTQGEKMPMIAFPSGVACELWESSDPQNGIVHLFGEMDLPLKASRDSAYTHAVAVAEADGYIVQKVGQSQLEVWGHDANEHLLITYDDLTLTMANVEPLRHFTRRERSRQPLLDDDSRKKLPPLMSGEKLGMNALVQVKFFTPDANWTWYASEFDGVDECFGLVIGQEIEIGSFWLSELADVHGPLGLPIERDRHFTPKTLQELKTMHQQARRMP